jgi:UDP-N-acetylmuramyl tripeptide synthase
VIGVTGTDGKSSVSTFLAQALHAQTAPFGVIGTLGAGFPDGVQPTGHTTPDAIRLQGRLAELLARGARGVAMEVSSHALDQDRVAGVAFDVAVLTNITRDHLDYHGDLPRYAAAKARLFAMPGLRHAVEVRPIDVTRSGARCGLEANGKRPAVRLAAHPEAAGRGQEGTGAIAAVGRNHQHPARGRHARPLRRNRRRPRHRRCRHRCRRCS